MTAMNRFQDVSRVPAAGLFLYDRDCGFCQRSVDFASYRVRSEVAFTPWQDFDLSSAGLTPAEANAQAWLLLPDGSARAGGDAITEILRRGRRWARCLGFLMRLPGVRRLNRAVYRLVASHRHRLPGGTSSCALPRSGV